MVTCLEQDANDPADATVTPLSLVSLIFKNVYFSDASLPKVFLEKCS